MPLLFLGGLGQSAFGSMQASILFLATPAGERPQLMGLLVVCIGTGPLGVLSVGSLAERLGADRAVAVMALAGLLALVACLAKFPALRKAGVEPD